MRTGPGLFDLDDFSVSHYWDGMAMLSKFDIKDGKVNAKILLKILSVLDLLLVI